MSLPEQNKKFLAEIITLYYSKRPLKEPSFLPKREIAIQPIGAKSYIRHLAFPSIIRLYEYIKSKPPLHLYYSSAIYENPSAESMDTKTWLGSELLFDIDADHYPGCSDAINICSNCGSIVEASDKCPKCSSEDIVKIPLLKPGCFIMAWNDALKIIDIMEHEFGAKQIEVVFSGHRGFHIKISDKHLFYLDRDERRAIIDYLMLKDIMIEKIIPPIGRKKNRALFLKEREYGLRARLRDIALKTLNIKDLGLVIEVDYDALRKILELTKVEIDPVVTMDITRLSRFINSINGKAGLYVCRMDPDEDFKPDLTRFEVFRGKILVKSLVDLPEITILGKNISLKKGEKKYIDATLAFYLGVKGLVEIINIKDIEVIKPRN